MLEHWVDGCVVVMWLKKSNLACGCGPAGENKVDVCKFCRSCRQSLVMWFRVVQSHCNSAQALLKLVNENS